MVRQLPPVARLATQRGVAYLALLVAIAVVGIAAANAVQLGSIHGQRDAEEELLHQGQELSHAMQRYSDATPSGLPRAPKALEELVRDPRYPGVRRHLRSVPIDPLTGKTDWVTLRDSGGRIVGIHSSSTAAPIRTEGPCGNPTPEVTKWRTYSQWIFGRPCDGI